MNSLELELSVSVLFSLPLYVSRFRFPFLAFWPCSFPLQPPRSLASYVPRALPLTSSRTTRNGQFLNAPSEGLIHHHGRRIMHRSCKPVSNLDSNGLLRLVSIQPAGSYLTDTGTSNEGCLQPCEHGVKYGLPDISSSLFKCIP